MIRIAKSLLLSFIALAIIINYQLASLTLLSLGIANEFALLSLTRKVVNYQLTQLGSPLARASVLAPAIVKVKVIVKVYRSHRLHGFLLTA